METVAAIKHDADHYILDALLGIKAIADAHVLRAATSGAPGHYIAFIALRHTQSDASLSRKLAPLLKQLGVDLHLHFVSNIPRAADGLANENMLLQVAGMRASTNVVVSEDYSRSSITCVACATDALPSITEMSIEPPTASCTQRAHAPDLSILEGSPYHAPPDAPRNLIEALERAARQESQHGILFIESEGTETRLDYRSLRERALRISHRLHEAGLKVGENAIIAISSLESFLLAFWGCVLAGVRPLPCAPPKLRASIEAKRLSAGLQLLNNPPVITTRIDAITLIEATERCVPVLEIDSLCEETTQPAPAFAPSADTTALYLMTSGSTGLPKLVVQTHAALLAYCICSRHFLGLTSSEVSLNWLSLEHVCGLVMFHLRDVWLGCEQIHVASPVVLAHLPRWFDLIDRHRVTMTWAPNFAFAAMLTHEHAVRLARWNLSCVKFILNAGETIVRSHTNSFLRLLVPHGLAARSMVPAWGMSETCSAVTYSATFADAGDDAGEVSVGKPVNGCAIRIVDANGAACPLGVAGALEVRGPMITGGYYRNETANIASFTPDHWLRTGDTGAVRNGQLVVLGRTKDIIIVNGAKFSCEEVESVAVAVPGVRATYAAAVTFRTGDAPTDQVAVLFVAELDEEWQRTELAEAINAALFARFSWTASLVVAVQESDIPKTSVGKIRRAEIRAKLERALAIPRDETPTQQKQHLLGVPRELARPIWQPKRIASTQSAPLPHTLTVIAQEQTQQLVAQVIKQAGFHTTVVSPKTLSGYQPLGSQGIDDPTSWIHVLRECLCDGDETVELLFVLNDASPIEADILHATHRGGLRTLHDLVSALTQIRGRRTVRLRVVAANSSPKQAFAALGSIAAWLRSVNAELPWLSTQLLILPSALNEPGIDQRLVCELNARCNDSEVLHTVDHRSVLAMAAPSYTMPARHVESGALYLITGGLGGVGQHVCRHLMRRYGARLLIVGRTAVSDVEQRLGVDCAGDIMYAQADAVNFDALRAVRDTAEERFGQPLRGVFHLAGELYPDMPTHQQTYSDIERVLQSKTRGTVTLLRLLEERAPGLLVLFSSVTALFGGAGVAAYAAACAYQQWLAQSSKYTVISIGWSRWTDTGMSLHRRDGELAAARGFLGLPPDRALALLDFMLTQKSGAWIAGVDRRAAPLAWQTAQKPRYYGTPVDAPETGSSESIPVNDTRTTIATHLKAAWSEALGLGTIGEDDTFFELGGHSLVIPCLLERINARFGLEVKALDLFRHSTVRSMTQHIWRSLQ